MTVYTFNGSIPTEIPGGVSEADHIAAGWKVAPDKPECPEGKEVVWLNWEWVIRDPQPENRQGYVWKWNHDEMQWVEYFYVSTANVADPEYVAAYANSSGVSIENAMEILSHIIPLSSPAEETFEISSLVSTSLSGLTSTQISALTSTSIPSL